MQVALQEHEDIKEILKVSHYTTEPLAFFGLWYFHFFLKERGGKNVRWKGEMDR